MPRIEHRHGDRELRRLREADESFKVSVSGGVGYYRLERSHRGHPGERLDDCFAKLSDNPRFVEQTHGRITKGGSDISAWATSCWYLGLTGGGGHVGLAHADDSSFFDDFFDAYEMVEDPGKTQVYMVKGNGVSQKASTNKVYPGFKEKLRGRGYPPPVEDFEKPVADEPFERGDNMSWIEAKSEGYVTVLRFAGRSINDSYVVYDVVAPSYTAAELEAWDAKQPEVRVYPQVEADAYRDKFISRLTGR
ncbi:MAG: hypothetical protein ABH834_04060 [Candidatus Altiarchaeota archaeon]